MIPRLPDDTELDPVAHALAGVLERHRNLRSGALADYIPELTKVDPEGFGAALVSVHGGVYSSGDADREFTIQSVSKPFVYALAVADLGIDEVSRFVGFEPSGEPFNAISLDPTTGRPDNPLINAGAIVAAALVSGADTDERFERVRTFLSACAGRRLRVDDEVYTSEEATGDRNRALAYLARSNGVLRQPVDDATSVYFRQCSLCVTAEDIAMMAATLANGGVNPMTGEQVMEASVATITLSIMTTCGMYDRSGEWMARVGLPAKSGVGGGIVAAQPSQFGIGVYSPRLDRFGNSVRGAAVLATLSSDFDLHVYDHPDTPRSPIAAWVSDDDGLHVDLRGELDLICVEEIIRRLYAWAGERSEPTTVHIDVTGVSRTRTAAGRLLRAVVGQLRADGSTIVFEGDLDERVSS